MKKLTAKRVRSTREIFFWPMIINIICLIGVLAALIGDNWWDVLSWLTLGVPSIWLLLIITPWPNRFFAWIDGSLSTRRSIGNEQELNCRD